MRELRFTGREPTRTQRPRWKRSTWHRVLIAVAEHVDNSRSLLAELVGTAPASVTMWLEGRKAMPLAVQWRM
jgi:hypothetical protein